MKDIDTRKLGEGHVCEDGDYCTLCGYVGTAGELVEIHTPHHHDWLCSDCERKYDDEFMAQDTFDEFTLFWDSLKLDRVFVLNLDEDTIAALEELAAREGKTVEEIVIKAATASAERILAKCREL